MTPFNQMQPLIPPLETPRLLIRPFGATDLAAAHRLFDPDGADITLRQRWLQWITLNYEALANLYQPPFGDRAIVLKSTEQLIGSCGLVPALMPFGQVLGEGHVGYNSLEMGLFYELLPEHRGQGYATEAVQTLIDYVFGALRLRRIVATTMDDNARSMAMMKRLGFTLYRNPAPEPSWCQVVGVLNNPYPTEVL